MNYSRNIYIQHLYSYPSRVWLPLSFFLHSLTTLNSIYSVLNTHFFTILSPTYPKKEPKMKNKISSFAQGWKQLWDHPAPRAAHPTFIFLNISLGRRVSWLTPEPATWQLCCFSNRNSPRALIFLLSFCHASLLPPSQDLHSPGWRAKLKDTQHCLHEGLWPQRGMCSSLQLLEVSRDKISVPSL